jgi:hypothetical protein
MGGDALNRLFSDYSDDDDDKRHGRGENDGEFPPVNYVDEYVYEIIFIYE